MAPNIQKLLLLTCLFLAFSCSQKQSGVKLEISNNFVFGGEGTSAISGGGLMVWGRNASGEAFGQALVDKDSINLQLNKGSWTFYAMAWDGTTDYTGAGATNIVFGGKVRCAKSPITKLESEAVAVDLVLSNDNCADSAYAGTVGTTGTVGNRELPKTQLNFCSHMGPLITSPTKKCADTRADPNRAYGKGAVSSYRITLRNFIGPASGRTFLPGGIKGKCVAFSGDNESVPGAEFPELYGTAAKTIPGLPSGGPGHPFHMTLEMFPGSQSCDDTAVPGYRGLIKKEFINGITFATNIDNKYFPDGSKHRQYVTASPAAICNGRSGSYADHPFAGGDGSIDRPYLICSVPQFHAINSFVDDNGDSVNDHFTKSFKLQANLDFNPFSNGIGANAPALFECLELGSNFLPIGYDGATCTGTGNPMVWGTITAFTGNFFGANFSLNNLRLRAEDKDFIGLFADFQGSYLSEIRLDKTELSGKQYVGGLAGNLQGSTQVWNIFGSRMNIEARDDSAAFSKVGTIFGSVQFGDVKNVIVKDSRVRGESSYIGGFAGFANGVTIGEVAIEADIDANSSSNKTDVGGVVGLATSSGLQFVKHEGGIYTNATKVGGILGSASTGTSLLDFYSISNIMTYNESSTNAIGGVIGEWSSTGNFGRGYTLSVVRSKCNTSCTEGAVAGLKSTTPTNVSSIYVLDSTESLARGPDPLFGHEASLVNLSLIRTPSSTTALTTGWQLLTGEYPRFTFEQHPCHLFGTSGSGAGTLLSPMLICNETQYYNLGSATAGTYHKLVSNLRLLNTFNTQYEIQDFNVNLLGNGKSLIGGYSNTVTAGPTGHILNLNGSISNIKIHGMGRETTDTTGRHGVFVASNQGNLRNIKAWTYPEWIDNGSGFVGTNSAGAMIKDITLDGIYKGKNTLSTIAVLNAGTISDSEVSGELACLEATGCYSFAGLVYQNTGIINKTDMACRIEDSGNPVKSASMLVMLNSNTAKITDVQVSPHADFKLGADGVGHYFHASNAGTLTRVVNLGRIIDIDNSYSSLISTPTDAEIGTGIHDGVFRTGGRSGKLLLEGSALTCNGTSLTISDWTNIVADPIVGDPAWETNFGTGAYSGFTPYTNKKLVAHVTLSDGTRFTEQITSYAGSDVFGIPTNYCATSITGEVNLYYSNDIPVDAFNDPLPGVMLPQFAGSKANYTPATTWNDQIWDIQNSTADLDEMLAYFKYLLKVSTTPVAPKAWELNEKGIELFEKN